MSRRTAIRAPTKRVCEQCDRRERWDDEYETWAIERTDGTLSVGDPYCLHEWDINGNFSPYA